MAIDFAKSRGWKWPGDLPLIYDFETTNAQPNEKCAVHVASSSAPIGNQKATTQASTRCRVSGARSCPSFRSPIRIWSLIAFFIRPNGRVDGPGNWRRGRARPSGSGPTAAPAPASRVGST